MIYIKLRLPRILALAVIAAWTGFQGAATAAAQSLVMTSITGTVTDPSGARVTGAEVTVKSLTNGTTQTAKSNDSGVYTVDNMPIGSYEITAAKYGFTGIKVRVVLEKRRQLHADLKLALAPVEPSAATPADADKIAALEARVEQLESEKKTAEPSIAAAAPPQPQQPQPPLIASASKDAGTLPPLPEAPKTTSSKVKDVLLAGLIPQAAPVAAAPQAAAAPAPGSAQGSAPAPAAQKDGASIPEALQSPEPGPPGVDNFTPFAYGDFTWLNGTPRNKDTVLDTKYFTPEIRFDTNFINDFNQPKDHTMGGSTEEFRNGEFQIEDIGIGGDLHWQNVRGRIMFMDGLFAVTTPRNDASSATGSAGGNTGGVGQWDLQNAYKYVSEAYGGYHFNVQHGLNVDAGIFVSYVGLFSYYNFDNWTYQPSYVSSNTPWFFEGVRIQYFPTNKLKIEPWIINGWQSYAKYNSHIGLGGQLLWLPTEWFKLVANQYGFGEDNLGLPNTQRIHTDDSIEVRYFHRPESLGIDSMAFSLTGDAGCQYGGGITCHNGPNKSSFLGWMAYDRIQWHKDLWGLTLGGGQMSNPGRYLTLLPPIDGAWAAVGSAYFTQDPGQPVHQWDSTITLHYMPKQYITWWAEVGYRHSDVPYFSGREGITPPGGNNGLPQYYTCASGASSMTNVLSAAEAACGGGLSSVWFPDLRRSTSSLGFGVMVKF